MLSRSQSTRGAQDATPSCDRVHTRAATQAANLSSRLGDAAFGNASAARRQEQIQLMIDMVSRPVSKPDNWTGRAPCFLIGSIH